MQRRWSEKNHTSIRDELFNTFIVGRPFGAYSSVHASDVTVAKPKTFERIKSMRRVEKKEAEPLPKLKIPQGLQQSGDTPNSPHTQKAALLQGW